MDNTILTPFLQRQGALILDGGLATELERAGHDLSDALWSARLLRDDPDAIRQVHTAYLNAGADCIATASYQATAAGFMRLGLSAAEADGLITRSVSLATAARDAFWADEAQRFGRIKPLVAASIGPYGAYLANGAEYTGEYELDEDGLFDFHHTRWQMLADSSADLLACETIPSLPETRALLRLARATPQRPVWISFSCRDARHIADGTPLAQVSALADAVPNVVAIGVNCVPPERVAALIGEVRRGTTKPVVVYPNSGEAWDAARRCWVVGDSAEWDTVFAGQVQAWQRLGARLIGGCCRTTPETIRGVRAAVVGHGMREQEKIA